MEGVFEHFRRLSAEEHKGGFRVTGGMYHIQRVDQVERVSMYAWE